MLVAVANGNQLARSLLWLPLRWLRPVGAHHEEWRFPSSTLPAFSGDVMGVTGVLDDRVIGFQKLDWARAANHQRGDDFAQGGYVNGARLEFDASRGRASWTALG